MTLHIRTAIAAILFIAIGGATIRAQDSLVPIYDFAAVDAQTAVLDRMQELEAEVASLRHELLFAGDCTGCDDKGCGGCGTDGGKFGKGYDSCQPTIEFWIETTLLRFHKTGGVQTGSDMFTGTNPEAIELGFIASPYVHLRWYRPGGLFIEGAFFHFNHSTVRGLDSIQINTYFLDFRFGQKFQVAEDWWIEWTGGPRRFKYEETLVDGTLFNKDVTQGVGGMVSLFAGRPIAGWLSKRLGFRQELYGGAIFAIVHGDHSINENRLPNITNINMTDENFIQLELSTGTEWIRTMGNGGEMFLRWGVQWITFENVSSQFNNAAPGVLNHEGNVAPGADVGFGGFNATLGFRW